MQSSTPIFPLPTPSFAFWARRNTSVVCDRFHTVYISRLDSKADVYTIRILPML